MSIKNIMQEKISEIKQEISRNKIKEKYKKKIHE